MNLLLQSIVQAAVEATSAGQGFLMAAQGTQARVVASAGRHPGSLIGQVMPAHDGPAGFVLGSGQPLILNPSDGPTSGVTGRPGSSVLCVPCSFDDRIHGALQLVDKLDGSNFTYDDLQIASLLSPIAGIALTDSGSGLVPPPPEEVAGALAQLAATDPPRYAALASMIEALLGPRG